MAPADRKAFTVLNLRALSFAALLAAVPASADVTYQWDDGTGTVNSGPNFVAPEFMWGNVYSTTPGGEMLTAISVAFGKISANQPMWLSIYLDPTPDDNPADATLLLRHEALTNPLGGNAFTSYAIPPTAVTGDFFVAISTPVNGTISDLPARLDAQGTPNASKAWFFASDGFDQFTLAQAPYQQQLSKFALPAVVMVRAQGIPSPSIASALVIGSMLAAARPRRSRREQVEI